MCILANKSVQSLLFSVVGLKVTVLSMISLLEPCVATNFLSPKPFPFYAKRSKIKELWGLSPYPIMLHISWVPLGRTLSSLAHCVGQTLLAMRDHLVFGLYKTQKFEFPEVLFFGSLSWWSKFLNFFWEVWILNCEFSLAKFVFHSLAPFKLEFLELSLKSMRAFYP